MSQRAESEKRRVRQEYGYVRGYFRNRPKRYQSYQNVLDKARLGTTYDVYLSDSLRYCILGGVIGSVIGAAVAAAAYVTNSPSAVTGDFSPLVSFVSVLVLAIFPAVSAWVSRYYYPYVVKKSRRYKINRSLPSAVVFMHALSTGGMSTVEVMEKLSESKDAYGEVAVEFGMVMRDIEYFNDDLLTALENAKEKTPSNKFEVFVDDMISVMESGGNLRGFLESESEKQIREVREENSDFLETLEVLAESYIILVFAAPIFLIVVLIALSFAGSDTLRLTQAVAYVVIPVSVVVSVLTIDVLNRQFEDRSKDLKLPKDSKSGNGSGDEDAVDDKDTRYEGYDRYLRRRRIRDRVTSPLTPMLESPSISLFVTIPLAFLFIGAVVLSGIVTPSLEAYTDDPVRVTTWIGVAPFLIPSTVLMVLHERKRRKKADIKKRFPEMLEAVSGANRNGVRLADCFEMVSRRSGGSLAHHLNSLSNDIRWNTDIERSLIVTANEIDIPRVSKSMKLIAEGSKSTGRLSDVLDIVAEDMDNRSRIEGSRKQTMSTYVVVIFVGVLVYLFIAVLFDVFFFAEIESVGREGAQSAESGFLSEQIPTDTFRMVLYHSALLQALGNGLVMGKLVDNRLGSGLVYANVLILIVTGVFVFA